ncbi:hypothetical protein PAHAL_3G375600 [Panicum hallii]|jgi:hypothetical protein|uniref:C2H2-type domain-containing protein n=1 Tax=Panicum hallii TaxID=206008 RepID=A0A2S3HD58_9POAL|nr:probable transcriptional regulator RABBIT EARS [Panicum hallii]PAN20325.1 hypothetical protein PAHAL_3G375600 [Panicum hallii]
MDPARYWMLNRRKLSDHKEALFTTAIAVGRGGSSSASYYGSWEERAFDEDSAGHLGGYIWPPRSYSCSFCGREFRSAQALGGHMNVHRRDRARLKLAGVADDGETDNQIMSDHQSYLIQPCPPQIAALQQAYGVKSSASSTETNPNLICSVLPCPSRSYVQAATRRTVWGEQVSSTPISSLQAYNIDYGKKEVILDASQLSQDARPKEKMCSKMELDGGRCELKLSVLGCRTRRDFGASDDDEIFQATCKRKTVDLEASSLVLYSSHEKLQEVDKYDGDEKPNGAKVLKLCPSSPIEELDLELRLGAMPKTL